MPIRLASAGTMDQGSIVLLSDGPVNERDRDSIFLVHSEKLLTLLFLLLVSDDELMEGRRVFAPPTDVCVTSL